MTWIDPCGGTGAHSVCEPDDGVDPDLVARIRAAAIRDDARTETDRARRRRDLLQSGGLRAAFAGDCLNESRREHDPVDERRVLDRERPVDGQHEPRAALGERTDDLVIDWMRRERHGRRD